MRRKGAPGVRMQLPQWAGVAMRDVFSAMGALMMARAVLRDAAAQLRRAGGGLRGAAD